jgi:hypothetical protein
MVKLRKKYKNNQTAKNKNKKPKKKIKNNKLLA